MSKNELELVRIIAESDLANNLISSGDVIGIVLDNSKLSFILFYGLFLYQETSNKKFSLIPLVIENITINEVFEFLDKLEMKNNLKLINHISKYIPKLTYLKSFIKQINSSKQTYSITKVIYTNQIHQIIHFFYKYIYSDSNNKDVLKSLPLSIINATEIIDQSLVDKLLNKFNLNYTESDNLDVDDYEQNVFSTLYNDFCCMFPKYKEYLNTALNNNVNNEKLFNTIVSDDSSTLSIKISSNIATIVQALYIRLKVFGLEQSVSLEDEIESDEGNYTTLVGYLNSFVVGTIRFNIDLDNKVVKIGRLAVLKQYRNKKIATKLLDHVEYLVSNKFGRITLTLNAQLSSKDFYLKRGYKQVGNVFMEANIKHIKMTKAVNNTAKTNQNKH